MIRLSVSDLESYRWWRGSDADLSVLLKRLAHEEPPSPQMEAGRAMAKLFETAEPGDLYSTTVDGWNFTFDLTADLDLPPVRELKGELQYETPDGPVTLVGKVDSLHGLTVRDQKLTEYLDAEKYLDSLQWRAYLVMFKAERFIYDVFVGRYNGQDVTVYDYARLPFYAYPNMAADVQRAVDELAHVVAVHMPESALARYRGETP